MFVLLTYLLYIELCVKFGLMARRRELAVSSEAEIFTL